MKDGNHPMRGNAWFLSQASRNSFTVRAIAMAAAGLLAAGLAACGNGESPPPSPERSTTRTSRSTAAAASRWSSRCSRSSPSRPASPSTCATATTAQMAAQLQEEGDKSPADVFLAQDAGALGAVTRQGLFAAAARRGAGEVPATYRSRTGEWVGVHRPVPGAGLQRRPGARRRAARVGVRPDRPEVEGQARRRADQRLVPGVRHRPAGAARRREGQASSWPGSRPTSRRSATTTSSSSRTSTPASSPLGLVNHYYLFELAKELGVTAGPAQGEAALLPRRRHRRPGQRLRRRRARPARPRTRTPGARSTTCSAAEAQTYFAEQTYEYPLVAGVPDRTWPARAGRPGGPGDRPQRPRHPRRDDRDDQGMRGWRPEHHRTGERAPRRLAEGQRRGPTSR